MVLPHRRLPHYCVENLVPVHLQINVILPGTDEGTSFPGHHPPCGTATRVLESTLNSFRSFRTWTQSPDFSNRAW